MQLGLVGEQQLLVRQAGHHAAQLHARSAQLLLVGEAHWPQLHAPLAVAARIQHGGNLLPSAQQGAEVGWAGCVDQEGKDLGPRPNKPA